MGILEGLLQFLQLVARKNRPATHPPRVVKCETQQYILNFIRTILPRINSFLINITEYLVVSFIQFN